MTIITDRDLRFLAILADYELMTTTQLSTRAFAGVDKRTVLRRLRKLEEERLIKRSHGLPSGELAWSLAHYGAFRIHRDSFLEKVNLNSLEHDTTLTELRLVLESSGAASSWTTEQHIRRLLPKSDRRNASEICPDAIFAVRTPKGFEAVALELELSGKNPSRYSKIFAAYGQRAKYFALWYIVDSDALGRKLQNAWGKANSDIVRPQFGWMLLKEILANPVSAKLHCKTGIMQLGSMIEVRQTNAPIAPAHTPASRIDTQTMGKINVPNESRLKQEGVPLPHIGQNKGSAHAS